MQRDRIHLAKPDIPENLESKISDILRSGNLVQGRYVQELEAALACLLNVQHAILVSSGTAALHLSLMSLDINRDDEIIVPAFTFPATANVVEFLGAKPIFVDICLDDYCIDASKIEKAITDRTRALIAVHAFGQPAEMDPISSIANKNRLALIEDAACALGTTYKHRNVGTLGRLGCFSFHPRKSITTGEGGLVVTDEAPLAEKIRALRNHGLELKEGHLDIEVVGLNYRMTEIQSVLGLQQLPFLEEQLKKRRIIASLYGEKLKKIPKVSQPVYWEYRPSCFQTYHLLLDNSVDRDALIASLNNDGIETNFGAHALTALTYYRKRYTNTESDFPNANQAYRQGLALPMGSHLNAEDIDYIVEKLTSHLDD